MNCTTTLTREEINEIINGIDVNKINELQQLIYYNQVCEPYYCFDGKRKSFVFKTERFLKLKEMEYFK